MAPRTHPHPSAKAFLAAVLVLATVLTALGLARPARAQDDVDLLRINGGQPYVFFILDTSGSMVLDPTDQWVPANGDDPSSKFYGVKQAIYDVVKDVDGVHFGLAGFNQDQLHVTAKHWLYKAAATADLTANFTYPTAANEEWTFGKHINATGEAGTCAAPLSLSGDLAKIDNFPRLGLAGLSQTTLWIGGQGNKTYQVLASLSPASTGNLGDPTILVRLQANLVNSCSPLDVTAGTPVDVSFTRVRDFLMVESNGPSTLSTTNCTGDETMKGSWPYTDVIADNTCGGDSGQPFTGLGWDSNDDSGARGNYDYDTCYVSTNKPGTCLATTKNPNPNDIPYDLRFPTVLNSSYPELDKGDVIPFNWSVDYKDEFLKRLNPMYPDGEDFGIASYFQNQPDAVSGLLKLKDDKAKPLIAFGHSPLGRTIVDFRCWYLGGSSNKCKNSDFDPGFEQLFHDNAVDFNCRVPYLIIISDGEDNGTRENATADVANLNSKSGVRTFVFTFKSTSQLHSIVQSGKGDLILVQDQSDLETQLRKVIGVIKESARTFASAAVPSVQAAVTDKIYLTNFTPLNVGNWDGHLNSFLKPLPIDPLTGLPDLTSSRHLWDAGKVMLKQAPDHVSGDTSSLNLQLGTGLDQRRVYYSIEPRPDNNASYRTWPGNRELFDRTSDSSAQLIQPELITPREPDFWKGLGIIGAGFNPKDPSQVTTARAEGNKVVEKTLMQKSYTLADGSVLDYILGDIFHSNPLIVGGPVNTKYFVDDAEETYKNGVAQGTGYQDFFLKHENRRKVIFAGANDSMFHAWDAGKASIQQITDDSGIRRDVVQFDDGTGRELFAYAPRSVLPTVDLLAGDPVSHHWSVDGSPVAGDVFIDPRGTGTPDPAKRKWRTVVIEGLRQGGDAYFALDVTQPDVLKESSIGPTASGSVRQDIMIPQYQHVVPDCANVTGDGNLGCDQDVKYPTALWEFTDKVWDDTAGPDDTGDYVSLDEDKNTIADLGQTWSKPDIGRIRVVENGVLVNKYVAIFGGGFDPDHLDSRGDFLYIVDIETGKAIYKRKVLGSVPADPAAVDTNQDGYINRIYFGTTAGALYRVDLEDDSKTGNARYPTLDSSVTVSGVPSGGFTPTYQVTRIERTDSDGNPAWDPQQIFSTCDPAAPTVCRPIYYAPTVLFVAKLGRYALGFGTGDRSDLFSNSSLTGRFYLFVDDSDLAAVKATLPLDETALTEVTLASGANTDLLTTGLPGHRGWYLTLNPKERLISNPFGLSGVTFFATFIPDQPTPTCTVNDNKCENPQCSLGGQSLVYVVGTTTANPLLLDANNLPSRSHEVHGFVTEPFTEQGLTKNSTSGTGTDSDHSADTLSQSEINIMNNLKQLFPKNCKFGNQRIDIKVIAADTHLERIAPVPVCIIEKNWKEVSQ